MVNRHLRVWLYAFLTSLVSISAASAADLPALTEKEVKLWISSYEALDQWSTEHQEQIEAHDTDETDQKTDVEQLLKPIKSAGLYKEADKLVRAQGYKSIEHWAEVALKIINASVSLAVEQYSGKPDNSAPAADKKLITAYQQQLKAVAEKAAQTREAQEAEEEAAEEEALAE